MSTARSFTVRVPGEMYFDICDLAQREGKKLNTKVNELLTLGLGRVIQLDGMLREMLIAHHNQQEAGDE
jgi:hypothetical protein